MFGAAFAAATLSIALLLQGCTSLFFYPDRHLYALPERFGVRYDTVHFPSTDGTELVGILMHATSPKPKGTVIQFHGNAQNVSSHFGYSYWLTAQGYQVFLFDYRGYGGSKGKPTEAGLVQDGIAAIEYVRRRPDVDGSRLVVWGQSLGGAVAVASLARLPDRSGVRALILEDTFESYRSIARDVLRRHWLTWPLQWLPWLLVSDRQKPAKYVDRLPKVPILVIHGDEDRVVPFRFGERLFARLKGPKEFWRVSGGVHLDAFTKYAEEFRPRLVAFLDRCVTDTLKPGAR